MCKVHCWKGEFLTCSFRPQNEYFRYATMHNTLAPTKRMENIHKEWLFCAHCIHTRFAAQHLWISHVRVLSSFGASEMPWLLRSIMILLRTDIPMLEMNTETTRIFAQEFYNYYLMEQCRCLLVTCDGIANMWVQSVEDEQNWCHVF